MPIRHVLALVQDGRVRVVDGRLPEVAGELSERELPARAEGEMPISPVRRLGDDERLWVLGRRTPLAGAEWADPHGLPVDVRDEVVTAIEEYDGARPVHPHRPDWFRPGWLDRVERWVDEALATRGRQRTGAVSVVRVWSLSAILRVPTDEGPAYLKAPCRHFRAEPALTRVLAARFPDLLPVLIAEDDALGLLLMEELPGTYTTQAPGAATALAGRLVDLQVASLDIIDHLVAAGAPERGLDATLAGLDAVLESGVDLGDLTADELAVVRRLRPRIGVRLGELWDSGLPTTVSHGDLHLGNVAYDGRTLRVFDWTDACLSHPLLDAAHLARSTGAGEDRGGLDPDVVRTIVEAWRRVCPDADVQRAMALARLADQVFQLSSYEGILRAIEPSARDDFSGVTATIIRRLPGLVESVSV